MKVLIDPRSNTLHDVAEEPFPVAPPLVWVDAPGPNFNPLAWEWRGGRLLPVLPVPPSASDGIAEARTAARAAVVESLIQAELAKPASDIPEIETLRAALG